MITISHIYNNESGLDARVKINSAFDALYSSGASIIEDTYVNIQTLVSSDSLTPGNLYKITNRADNGIILLAVTTNKFSLEGQGIFLNPDFQVVGDYSGVAGYNSTQGVWNIDFEAFGVDGDVVFWGGLHYVVVSAGDFNNTPPDVTTIAYTLLPKSTANVGYIEEVDFILYDFNNDSIFERHDKRGNIWNPSYITSFQAGNDQTLGNVISYQSDVDIINQRGLITNNTFAGTSNGYLIAGNDFTGFFRNNYLKDTDVTVEGTAQIEVCNIQLTNGSIVFITGSLHTNKTINDLGSTFEANLNMVDGTDFKSTPLPTLQIPTNYNYVGIFHLINNSGQTIEYVSNLPTHRTRFYVESGSTQIFSHTSVDLAIQDSLVSDTNSSYSIVGRTDGSDFIEYERSGGFNRKYNYSIAEPLYRKYVALVTQSGVLAPTAIVLENTLGVSTSFTYDGAGQYLLKAAGAFASGKVVFYSSQPSSDAQMVTGQMDSNDTYSIGTIDNNFYTDQLLNNTTIEIRVYP